MSRLSVSLLVIALFALNGCQSAPDRPSEMVPGGSMVAIHIDMSKAPNPYISALWLQCDTPGTKFGAVEMKRDGKTSLFYLENVPAGNCWIVYGWSAPGLHLRFERGKPNVTAVRLAKGEFRYMGSFQYNEAQKHGDTFRLDRVRQPSETEAVRRLLPHLRETGWAPLLERRLSVL